MKWSRAKRRKYVPVTEQEQTARALSRKASAILGERLVTGRQIITPAKSHHAQPPQVLVAQVAAHILATSPHNRPEPWSRTMQRAEHAMKRAHYPGIEQRGSTWVIRTKERIDHGLRKHRRARADAHQFTGEPEPSVPPVGVQAPRG